MMGLMILWKVWELVNVQPSNERFNTVGGHGMFGAFDINTMCPVLGQGMMSALVLWSLWDTIG